ncbi:hypothetical protein [Psychroserpens sp.]|uniref:hypothetical protein n=1 Tax=Psychroserpens sp. TaxID=2020870 RepID=UPI002B2715B0|nr:hypothetical protein [Psychroserpens sp.]
MRSLKNRFVLVFISLCFSSLLIAQDDILKNENTKEENTKDLDSSHISLSLNYISDAVYMGRKDSISAPYLYPALTYHHKSGFYANGSLSYLVKSKEGRVDLFLLTAGFDFAIKKIEGDISFTKYFFNEDSYNVISEVETDLSALMRYDFNIINVSMAANTYFNSDRSSDFFLSLEINRDIITKNKKFQFSPTVGVNFGSQNFYEQYYINNRFGNGRGQSSGQGQGNSSTSQSTSVDLRESKKFNLMAIEFSLPIWYVHKSFNVVIMPTYVIPQNEGILSVDDVLVEENLDNTFYFITGITYSF